MFTKICAKPNEYTGVGRQLDRAKAKDMLIMFQITTFSLSFLQRLCKLNVTILLFLEYGYVLAISSCTIMNASHVVPA